MLTASSQSVTSLLRVWRDGDQSALARLIESCYPELRKIACGCLKRERPGHTVQATALVHEAYLRLIDARQVRWQDRAHFFAIAAKLMRRILTDYARARDSSKRGAGARPMALNEGLTIAPQLDPEIIRLDDALQELAKFDSRKAQVVEMRYFGGLTADEIADVLAVSRESVNRDWRLAKAWLSREMAREKSNGCPPLGRD
ncbi:MAG: sigma-70 family RNA polymerase sigma factor [Acidobacteriaceae bacterium]|nr:sigma-70 family RNA polymerase sigma factor [Acidobacteriaceae bacterium]